MEALSAILLLFYRNGATPPACSPPPSRQFSLQSPSLSSSWVRNAISSFSPHFTLERTQVFLGFGL